MEAITRKQSQRVRLVIGRRQRRSIKSQVVAALSLALMCSQSWATPYASALKTAPAFLNVHVPNQCFTSEQEAAQAVVSYWETDSCPNQLESVGPYGIPFHQSTPLYCPDPIAPTTHQVVEQAEVRYLYRYPFDGACLDMPSVANGLRRRAYFYCPTGYQLAGFHIFPYCVRDGSTAQTDRNLGEQECLLMQGNPINVATGNKYQVEVDYGGGGAFPLQFERHYNSLGAQDGTIGNRWRHSYERNLVAGRVLNKTVRTVRLTRADGEVIFFDDSSGALRADVDAIGELVEQKDSAGVTTGWQFVGADDVTEYYDSTGRLLIERSRSGVDHQLFYGTDGRLIRVEDSFGKSLVLNYDASGRVAQLVDPAGEITTFSYANGNLTSVAYADGSVKGYLYNEPGLVAANAAAGMLTGVIDAGQRYATYAYDASSRAVSSEHANGDNRVEITYNSNGTRLVRDAAGAERVHSVELIGGKYRPAGKSGGICGGCGPGNDLMQITYDPSGNRASATNFNGVATTYIHNTRHLETQRTEASGTQRARTITKQWHSNYRRPTRIDEPDKRTTYGHDANGNVLTRTELDTTASTSRTWTYTYNSYGQMLTANGPRADVNDVTTYTY